MASTEKYYTLVKGVFFAAKIRELITGTKAVVESPFTDVKYNAETDEVSCTLYDHAGLRPMLEEYVKVFAPCKVNLNWKEEKV